MSESKQNVPEQNIPRTVQEYLTSYHGWVHHCSRLVAESVASNFPRLYVATSRPAQYKNLNTLTARKSVSISRKFANASNFMEILDHPLLDKLYRPNSYHTYFEFFTLIQLHLGLNGNAYIVKGDQLHLLNPAFVSIERGDVVGVPVKTYIYKTSHDKRQEFTPEQIIHIRSPNPMDIYGFGFADIFSEINSVELSCVMDEYENITIKNSAAPSYAIVTKDDLSPENVKAMRDSWVSAFSGKNMSLPVVLKGDTDIKPLGLSPQDISFLKGEEKIKTRIAAAFGVPLPLVNGSDSNSYAQAKLAAWQFNRQTITPKLKNLAQILTEHLAVEVDPNFFFAFDDIVVEDRLLELQERDMKLRTGQVTVNELRREDNYPVFGPEYDVPTIPINPAGSSPNLSGALKSACSCGTNKVVKKSAKLNKFEKVIAENLLKQVVDCLNLTSKAASDSESYSKKVIDKLKKNAKKAAETFAEDTKEYYSGYMLDGVDRGLKVIPKNKKFDKAQVKADSFELFNPESSKFLDTYTLKLSAGLGEETERGLKALIQSELEAGSSIEEMKKNITADYETISKSRAENIARSESSRAMNAGEVEAWKQSGVVAGLQWQTNSDGCDYCNEIDGKTVEINELFFDKGDTIQAGDKVLEFDFSIGHPPAHSQCRCTLIPILVED